MAHWTNVEQRVQLGTAGRAVAAAPQPAAAAKQRWEQAASQPRQACKEVAVGSKQAQPANNTHASKPQAQQSKAKQ
jgi:hypothetical protein